VRQPRDAAVYDQRRLAHCVFDAVADDCAGGCRADAISVHARVWWLLDTLSEQDAARSGPAGAGVVHSVQHRHRAGGIDVRLLFGWNALMLRLDDGNFAEYVHIRHSSSRVRVGQRVEAGQVLCESGDVGFCPTPHLHFTVYASDASNADTIPFAFADKMSASAPSAPFVPVAGCWYDKSGRVSSPANSPRREDTA